MKHRNISFSLSRLASEVIDVRPIVLRPSDDSIFEFESILSPGEKRHFSRFYSERLRRAAITGRASLRILLSHYLGVPPASIRFEYGPKGKPRILASGNLDFSVSHSNDLLVMAFTIGCGIGIDVEKISPFCNIDEIASLLFCSEEAADLASLPSSLRQHAFFLCWTRKEAYVKAVGDGLSIPLNQFRVTLRPGEPAAFIHFGHDPRVANDWTLHNLELGHNWAAALAYKDVPRPIQRFEPLEISNVLEMLWPVNHNCRGIMRTKV